MSLAGPAAVCIWHDIAPEATDEFYQWHNREHMPERVGIPGFLRGRRYIAIAGAPTYFNLYEADSAEVLARFALDEGFGGPSVANVATAVAPQKS